MTKVAGFVARWLLALLGMILLSALTVFVCAAYLTTYPLLGLTDRDRKLQAALNAATAVAALVAALRPEPGDEVPPPPTAPPGPPL